MSLRYIAYIYYIIMKQVINTVNINTHSKLTNDNTINGSNINKLYNRWFSLISQMEKNKNSLPITYKHSSYHYTNFL